MAQQVLHWSQKAVVATRDDGTRSILGSCAYPVGPAARGRGSYSFERHSCARVKYPDETVRGRPRACDHGRGNAVEARADAPTWRSRTLAEFEERNSLETDAQSP
jgi:hypothetical protein